jgi:hypothetical protein
MTMSVGDPIAAPRRRRWPRVALLLVLLLAILFLTITSGAPSAPARGTVTAEQVGAGRSAVEQLRRADARTTGTRITYGRAELDGIGALVSHGFDPDRLDLAIVGQTLTVTGSHRLPLGRWLDVAVTTRGGGKGFPPARLRIGAITLPEGATRQVFGLARRLANGRGVRLPPLDSLVRDVAIARGSVAATIRLPQKTAIVDQISALESDPVDRVAVARLYCGLATAQRRSPSADLTTHLHRAFVGARGQESPAAYNRAAFVALAMLLVDPRAGDLAGSAVAETERCRIDPVRVTLHDREDLPKHWALSAALSAGAGGQLARALGEWKELADSLSKQSSFAVGDPSGFSFVDLAADRSGFGIARAASGDDAARIAARLAIATPQDLLPVSLLAREESLTSAAFTKRYGSIDDPRYARMVAEIDAVLAREAIR